MHTVDGVLPAHGIGLKQQYLFESNGETMESHVEAMHGEVLQSWPGLTGCDAQCSTTTKIRKIDVKKTPRCADIAARDLAIKANDNEVFFNASCRFNGQQSTTTITINGNVQNSINNRLINKDFNENGGSRGERCS
jgi:hypothetical protein